MKRLRAPAPLALAAALGAGIAGCGPEDEGPNTGPCEGLLAGDLVITEVMANPASQDQGNEYFEIYNASGSPIDLGGLTLVASLPDGSDAASHTMDSVFIEPGEYMALGGVLPEFKPAWIDYGYANDLGGLRNAGARVALLCGAVEVDELIYGESESGRSLGLDGNIAPDSLVNDVADNFCSATTEFAEGAFGSPGVANEPCSIVAQGTCLDGDTERDVVRPGVGDLIVAEVMPNPCGRDGDGKCSVDDSVGEWFELVALADFDLNGVAVGEEIGDPKLSIFDERCLSVTAGTHVVFARSADPTENGGLPVVDYTFSFNMANGSDGLFVATEDEVIDSMTWTDSPTGASLALHPTLMSATDNDVSESYCTGVEPYGIGDLGTPGTANTACALPGMCQDGESFRPVVPPEPGDVTITEIMANPTLVSDAAGEWFEVRVSAGVDVNGLQVGRNTDPAAEPSYSYSIDSVECLSFATDTYLIFARNTDPGQNGGLPTENIFGANITLASDDILFVGYDDRLLTSETFGQPDAGAAFSLDPDGDQWCPAVDDYNGQDLGTPGAANPQCP